MNRYIIKSVTAEHPEYANDQFGYQVWIYDQETQEITHQFQSDKETLEEALEDTFQQWMQLYPESNIEDWEEFIDSTGNEELYIHSSSYGIIYQ